MTTSYGHDQDAEPPTPDGRQPDLVESDTDDLGDMGDMGESGQGGGEEPASHPDPEPGADHAQAGSDS